MITYIQSAIGTISNATLNLAYGSNNSVGNFLIAAVRFYNTTSPSAYTCTDSQGNTWIKLGNTIANAGSTIDLWYVANCKAGANTVTMSTGVPNNPNPEMAILEYSGIALVSSFDVSASAKAGANSNAPNSGPVTTSQAVELLIGFASNETAGGLTNTPAGGWTPRVSDGDAFVLDQITSTAGSYTFTSTLSANVSWSAYIAAFKATPVAPPPAPATVNPTSGAQGATISNFTVTGTNFDAGGTSTLSFSGSGITVNSYGTRNANTLIANITIAGGATLGARDIIITNLDTQTGTLAASFTVTAFVPPPPPPPPIPPANIFVPIPFGDRLTACVVTFACVGVAAPAGAQKIAFGNVGMISALQLAYAQLLRAYALLINTDSATARADLTTAITAAVAAVGMLNSTLQGMTAVGDAAIQLAGMQIVVYNSLQSLLKVQGDESF